jgi:hypothetical protein
MMWVHQLRIDWALHMRLRAPPGQDFLWRLPGGLPHISPLLPCHRMATMDAEAHVQWSMLAKQRGNDAFVAGDIATALRHYFTAIDHQRPLAFWHLQRATASVSQEAAVANMSPAVHRSPGMCMARMRYLFLPTTVVTLYPYQGLTYASAVRDVAKIYPRPPTLSTRARLPGCQDLQSLVGRFWSELTAKFMEPYGGPEGALVNGDAWPHRIPPVMLPKHYFPDA